IGGNLSSLDLMMCLYHQVLGEDDTFVLSKGHAAGSLYTTLWSLGYLNDEDLQTFHQNGTKLAGHPPAKYCDVPPCWYAWRYWSFFNLCNQRICFWRLDKSEFRNW
ncbi:MAG: hypothetical protein ACKPHO_22235, partial [Dolichospermum sp.]